jgi:nitrite reductase (NADH) small subunit
MSLPVVNDGGAGQWVRATTRAELDAAGAGVRVKLLGRWVALLIWQGRVHAIDDRCPHRGSSLAEGIVEPDGYVSCLDHGWEYSLTTGEGKRGFEGCAPVFPVEEREGGEIWVRVTPPQRPAWAEDWDDWEA